MAHHIATTNVLGDFACRAASSSSSSAAPSHRHARLSTPIGGLVPHVSLGRRRLATHVARVAKKGPEPGELSESERRYREMMKTSKEWMAYDPDELPASAPAPWETHVQTLMREGPWPCWDPVSPDADFEPEPEFISFKETPDTYDPFDDRAKIFKQKLAEERARMTAERQAEIRARRWMPMDGDVRLKDIPSCNEDGWTHAKILELINFPEDAEKSMMEYSVFTYDPRFPCDNTWIPPPAPDTWEFIKSIGHGEVEGLDDKVLGERLAAKNGIVQRLESEADTNEFLNQTSETKLARAIDIGEDDDDDIDDEDDEVEAVGKEERERNALDSDDDDDAF